jgi:hypothetical protein
MPYIPPPVFPLTSDVSANSHKITDLATPTSANDAATKAYADSVGSSDAELSAIAGLTSAANKLPYFTGSGTAALADFTSAGRALVDDADASAQRTTLGLGTMALEAKTITTQDDLLVGGASGALARLAKGSDGQVLTVDPTTHHLVWANAASGFTNPMTTAGDVIVGDTGGAAIRLPKGADNQVLTIDPTTHLVVWANSASGFSNPMTTKGDVIVGDTGGAAIRKAVGTDGQVLTADAASTGGVKWDTPTGGGAFVGASVYNSANQTITGGGSGTTVLFDSEHFDTDAFHSTASNTGRLTIPSGGGNYFAVFNGALAAADGDGAANVQIHGVFGGSDLIVAAVPITGLTLLNITTPIIDFAAGDYLYVVIFTGSNRTLSFAARYSPEFSIAKL